MIKNYYKIICIFLLLLFFTGCWDYRDIDKRAINLSIGVDEVNGMLQLTGEIAKLTVGGGTAEITETYKYRSLGKYFEGSRDEYDARVTNPSFTGAVRSVVFSKKYAEMEGIESYVNRVYHVPEFRNSVLIAISKGTTDELFNGKVKNDISIGYAIENTIKALSDNGAALYKTLQQVKADIEFKDIGYLLPYINISNNTIEYLGLAAIKDSKLTGIIKREESNGFLFVLSKKAAATMPVSHPGDEKILVSMRNLLKERKIKTSYENNKVNIYIDLNLNSQLLYLYEIRPVSKNDIKKLEKIISDKIKEDIMSALELSKSQFKSDVFGFARYFKADNPEEYKKMNWKEEYPETNFHVSVKATIINTSLLDLKPEK